eukprot:scaffold107756_cov66-Phaeocystis_antarctica.AAC.1
MRGRGRTKPRLNRVQLLQELCRSCGGGDGTGSPLPPYGPAYVPSVSHTAIGFPRRAVAGLTRATRTIGGRSTAG